MKRIDKISRLLEEAEARLLESGKNIKSMRDDIKRVKEEAEIIRVQHEAGMSLLNHADHKKGVTTIHSNSPDDTSIRVKRIHADHIGISIQERSIHLDDDNAKFLANQIFELLK